MIADTAGPWFASNARLKQAPQVESEAASPKAHLLSTFERMLESYQDKVFRLACGMLGNETSAEDVTQDVFMKIWKALPNYRSEASASSWIYTITRNTCLSELKKSSLRRNASLADEKVQEQLDHASSLAPSEGGAGRQMDVEVILAQLPGHYRRVIALFYLEQKSYEEVALMLNIPIGTVKTYLHRAKKELMRLGARGKENYA